MVCADIRCLSTSVLSPAAARLLHLIRRSSQARLPLLLCSLVLPGSSEFHLPSGIRCALILSLIDAFDKAQVNCRSLRVLQNLPPTVLGRLSRSTGCVLCPGSCSTAALFLALCSPSSLDLSTAVGCLVALDAPPSLVFPGRVLGLSSSVQRQLDVPVCVLRSPSGPLFLSLRDDVLAARKMPVHLSELRALLTRTKTQRLLCRWLAPLCESGVQPSHTTLQACPKPATYEVLLSCSFEQPAAAAQWRAGSEVLHQRMRGPLSARSWGSVEEATRLSMLSALRFAKSAVIQQVLSYLPAAPLPVSTAGHWVYALISPF